MKMAKRIVVMVVMMVMFTFPSFPSFAKSSADSTEIQKEAVSAFEQINTIRTQNGLNALVWMDELGSATMTRATEASVCWSHTRPDGSDWYTVNPDLMYGENLAEGYSTADAAVKAWMASPSHKANILDARFTNANIQIYQDANGHWYWANEFYY